MIQFQPKSLKIPITCLVPTVKISLTAINMALDSVEFTWAENFPEVKKVCCMFGRSELKDPVAVSYTRLDSYLQIGPQCGLVALAMYKRNPTEESVKQLFEIAKNKGFTNHGEMFSVPNMAALAQSELDSVNVQIFKGCLNCEEIKTLLLHDACLLVPFDLDVNLAPGLFNGNKAHWAIVCGGLQTQSDFYVFARHGTQRNIAIWKLSQLAESNAQLNEYNKYTLDKKFRLPEGGTEGPLGLKNQSIVLKSSCT